MHNQKHRNVVLIFADQLRADALGCYGNAKIQTSNIDRLAAEGCTFNDCMVTQATCTPSRASILTGVFPSALRSRMVGCRTPDDPRFLPRVSAGAGYRTASIGKIHLVPQGEELRELERTAAGGKYDYYGFQDVDLVDGHGDRCFGNRYSKWVSQTVPDYEKRRRRPDRPNGNGSSPFMQVREWDMPPEVHSSNYIGDSTVAYLNNANTEARPFFLHVSFPDPHVPFIVPEPYASMYPAGDMPEPIPSVMSTRNAKELHKSIYYGASTSGFKRVGGIPSARVTGTPPDNYSRYTAEDWKKVRATYYGMTSLVDRNIGRILDTLQKTGLAENTLVVFVCDHGYYLGDHGLLGKGLHYHSAIQTPLIYRGPGIDPGHRVAGVSTTLDIAPTILDWAGVSEPEAVQGISQLPILQGGQTNGRTAVLTENDDDLGAVKFRTITTREWKMTCYAGDPEGELYQRVADPDETVNLWDDPSGAAAKTDLSAKMVEELMCSIDQANGRVQPPQPEIVKWIPLHNREIIQ